MGDIRRAITWSILHSHPYVTNVLKHQQPPSYIAMHRAFGPLYYMN